MRRLACLLLTAAVTFSVLGCGESNTVTSVPEDERKPMSPADIEKMKRATAGALPKNKKK